MIVSRAVEWIAGSSKQREILWGVEVLVEGGWCLVFENFEPLLFETVEQVQLYILEIDDVRKLELYRR